MADPANCTVDAFDTNRTSATKMTTRSKELSTRETRVGATCSEIMFRSSAVPAAMEHLPRRPAVSIPPLWRVRKPLLGGEGNGEAECGPNHRRGRGHYLRRPRRAFPARR